MRVFVTGATGFIGGHVARLLRERGDEVVALVRSPSKAKDLEALGVTIAPGDITDKDSMRAPMTGCDAVLHVAAWYEVGARDATMAERINVHGTRNVVELIQELSIPRAVYTSTLAVFSDTGGKLVDETYYYDGPHLSEYDRTKWVAHYEVVLPAIQAGAPIIIVQPGAVYGPGDHSLIGKSLQRYLKRKLPARLEPTAVCWAHVEDTARGHLLALDKGTPGEAYIIAGPPHSLIEALSIAERITGVKPPRMKLGKGMIKLMSAMMKPIAAIFPVPEMYHPETLRVSTATYLGDNARARRELGFEPRPLEPGLRETLIHDMRQLGMNPPAEQLQG